jgi:hypothetical protein
VLAYAHELGIDINAKRDDDDGMTPREVLAS